MFPQDVTHKVRRQVQEAVFPHRAQNRSVHAELVKVDILQTELVHCPRQPLGHMVFCPLPGI